MRFAALTFIGSLALAAAPIAANAAPAMPNIAAPGSANLIQVSGGCGPAFHRNPWGYCVANQYYGYGYAPYYGGGYYYYNHPYWHHHWW